MSCLEIISWFSFIYCTYSSLNTCGIKFIKLIIVWSISNLFYLCRPLSLQRSSSAQYLLSQPSPQSSLLIDSIENFCAVGSGLTWGGYPQGRVGEGGWSERKGGSYLFIYELFIYVTKKWVILIYSPIQTTAQKQKCFPPTRCSGVLFRSKGYILYRI